MLGRCLIAVEAFCRAREAGEKHWVAIQAAVDAVKEEFPEVPVSATEVKAALAAFQPKGVQQVFLVNKVGKTWVISIGPRPSRRRK